MGTSLLQGLTLFQKGGIIMYVLLLCSLFVVYIAIERYLYYKQADSGQKFATQYYQLLKDKNEVGASQLSKNTSGRLAQILSDASELRFSSPDKLSNYFEIQSGILFSQLRKRLYYLNVIVTMAPLLGLLGTISGMITSFSVFNIESGQAVAITGGVGEALIATAMGLCVAIIALSVHAYFTQRLDRIITDMELCFSTKLLSGEDAL